MTETEFLQEVDSLLPTCQWNDATAQSVFSHFRLRGLTVMVFYTNKAASPMDTYAISTHVAFCLRIEQADRTLAALGLFISLNASGLYQVSKATGEHLLDPDSDDELVFPDADAARIAALKALENR